jgi:hypothetical protein
MPKARVIARDHQRARQTVDSLHASGYEVEIVAPGETQVEPCDLTINLEDLPADQSIYSLDEAESYFVEGDPSPKREFIFAPAWRKLSELARVRYQMVQQRRSERRQVAAALPPEPNSPAPQALQQLEYERIAAEFAAQRTQLEAAFVAQLEAIKEERRAQGTEIWRLQQELAALRQQNEFLAASRVEAPVADPTTNTAAAPASAWRTPDLKPRIDVFTKRFRQVASDSSRQAGRATLVAASWMRDLTMRPSFSVAAGIVFAFLLGFWAATGKHQPEARPTTPEVEANVSSASVVPASVAVAKKPAVKAATPKVRKPSPVKQAAAKQDEGFQEVVVRHYPNRGNIAKTESPNKVKQYSDIDEQ